MFNKIQKILLFGFLLLITLNIYPKNNNNIYIDVSNVNSPYFGLDDDQKAYGYIVDLFNIINKDKYNIFFVKDTLRHKNKKKILGYITKNEVPENYKFIETSHRLDYYVFTRKNTDIKSLNDLLNKKIIILKDDLPFKILYKYKASYILEVKSYNYAINLLAKGTNDCAIVPYQIGRYIIDKNNLTNINYVITPLLSFNYGIAIPKEYTEIINTFKAGLQQSIENNEYKIIENKWFKNINDKHKLTKKGVIIFILLLLAVVIIIFLLIIIHFLRYEINASTRDIINELNLSNYSPLTVDINKSLTNDLLTSAPMWVFINDINGKIHKISKYMLSDIFDTNVQPKELNVKDIFDKDLSNKMMSYDISLINQKPNLIVEKIKFSINNDKYDKILIKYPLKIKGKNRMFFINMVLNPIVYTDFNKYMPSPDYLFTSVINALPDLIFIKNKQSEYIGGNKAFFDFYETSKEELIGKTDFSLTTNRNAEIFLKSDKEVLNSGKTWSKAEWATKSNGELLKFENIKIPLYNKKNEISGLVGISHDITKRYQYEQELKIAKEKVEKSDKVKSSFLVNVSSEIRTPVNSITGFSDLLLDTNLTVDQRVEIIDMIKTNGHALIDLVDDIIDFSRLESGQIHLKYSDFDLNSIIKNVYDYANLKKSQFGKEHMNISFNIGALEDIYMINSDPFRLRQVLKNLVNNTIRFSSSDSIYLGYKVNNDKLIIYVKYDNNTISNNVINQVSYKEKTKLTLSSIEKSSGISIIIAERVVEMLGGKFYIEKKELNLFNFYLSIPLKQVDTIVKTQVQENIMEVPDWSGKTVLVAEDEEINFILIEEVLKKTNIKIIRALDGREAIMLYKENISDIDLVLMDIRMPVVNGVVASNEILEIDTNAIIVALTAYVIQEDKERYMSAGIKAVIAKPVETNELYYTCNKYLLNKK